MKSDSLLLRLKELEDQTWHLAWESLDQGQTHIYRSLVDIMERLVTLHFGKPTPENPAKVTNRLLT
jgi:hypothetical protein